MNDPASETPEAAPAAPAEPDAASPRPDPDFDDAGKTVAAKGKPGWRDGPRDMARGAEFGVWFTALVSAPVACALFGGSLAIWGYGGFALRAVPALAAFAGRWIGIALTLSVPIAAPAGVVAWLYRGIAKRLGRPGPDRPTRRRRRRRRWVVVAGLGTVGLVAGALGMSHLVRTSFRDAEQAVAETDAIDPYWRLDDLLASRDEVPDDENSALVAADVVAILGHPWPPTRPKGEEAKRGVDDVLATYSRIGEADDSRRMSDADAAALGNELDARADAVNLARSLADHDRGRHEYEIGPTVLDTSLAETENVRSVVRLLHADAIVAAHDGQLDDAAASCRAMIAAGRSIGDEPFMVGQLVRIAIDAVACRATRRVLGQGEPSDEALAALQVLLLDERDQPRAWWALRGERAQQAEIIRRIAEGEMPISALSKGWAAPPSSGMVSGILVVGGWHQFSVALCWSNDLIAILDLPENQWAAAVEGWDAKIQDVGASRLGTLTATLPLLLAPSISVFIPAETRIRADLGSLAVLIAAERQRRATGKWPTSAEDIDPEILPDPPLDPHAGEPFRVKYADGRLRVYSVGANLKDEHGAYDPRKATTAHVEDDVGTYAYDPELRGRPAVAEEE